MKRVWATFNLIFILSIALCGEELVYPSFLIPDTLQKDANAVCRNMECKLTIQSDNSAEYSMIKVVTVLNKNGDNHGAFYEFYDDHRKISGISIKIYDAHGRLIEKVKSSDIKDFSAVLGFSLYEDDRVRVYEPVIKNYPYTVVMEVKFNYNGYLQFPRWQPQDWPIFRLKRRLLQLRCRMVAKLGG